MAMNPSTETRGITRKQIADDFDAIDQQVSDLNDHKRELLVSYRAQLTASGMGKDEIKSEVEAIKAAIKRRRAVAKEGALTVEEKDALVDEVFAEITSPAPRATRVAIDVPSFVAFTSDGSEYAYDAETGEITEPQPIPQAERGLTDPKPLGQVATNPEAKASEDGGATVQHIGSADDSVTGDVSRASDGAGPVATIQPETAEHVGEAQKVERRSPKPEDAGSIPAADANAGSSNGRTAEFDSADAGSTPAPASIIYPAPGVVVMETCPPEGALAHPYAACWPVRDIDVSEGVREPIVKIGKLILDGRGRMFAARGWDGGKGREYPVVQYDGTDPLMDCIRWNLASRPGIHSHNLKLIAGKLAKLEPTRADEIMQAFGLEVAEAAE